MDLIRTRRRFLKMVLMVPGLGVGCLSVGCGGGGKSDGQIAPAPEAANASQAVAQQYAKQYSKNPPRKGGRR